MNKKKSCTTILVGVVRVRVLHVTKGMNSHQTCGGEVMDLKYSVVEYKPEKYLFLFGLH